MVYFSPKRLYLTNMKSGHIAHQEDTALGIESKCPVKSKVTSSAVLRVTGHCPREARPVTAVGRWGWGLGVGELPPRQTREAL